MRLLKFWILDTPTISARFLAAGPARRPLPCSGPPHPQARTGLLPGKSDDMRSETTHCSIACASLLLSFLPIGILRGHRSFRGVGRTREASTRARWTHPSLRVLVDDRVLRRPILLVEHRDKEYLIAVCLCMLCISVRISGMRKSLEPEALPSVSCFSGAVSLSSPSFYGGARRLTSAVDVRPHRYHVVDSRLIQFREGGKIRIFAVFRERIHAFVAVMKVCQKYVCACS